MSYLDQQLPNVDRIDSVADFESMVKDAIKRDDGNYFTQAQVKTLLIRSRQRAVA